MSSNVDSATSQLLEDFDKVVRDSESLLRSLANVSGEKAVALRDTVETNLNNAKARLAELRNTARQKATYAAKEADAYVHENPWTSVAVAAALGVIIGLVISTPRR